jgi:3-(3-hydroxy-phenyl)propionate hydroxylase
VTVLVVGAGPTGLAAANLLGRFGVDTLVLEREPDVASEPRAVSVDDEAMRLLQWAGLSERAAAVARPGTGTRYYGARGQLLAAATAPAVPPLGHPIKNPIDHGAFTCLLLDGLAAHPAVEVRFGAELVGLEVAREGAVATVRTPAGEERLEARFVLGCDGGRSAVRRLLGIAMEGESIREPWLVIDAVRDPHDERHAMHHGDPRRPHVVLPGGDGRCRYEFLLLPGEDEEQAMSFPTARRLLAPFRGSVSPEDILRQRVYVFHSLVAAAWRRESAFLLGDAAHMMPPFAGQGLNTGLRDAASLAWRVAAVMRGELGERVLDSYEGERRPHAEAMVRLSVRRGRTMMTRSRARAFARDAAVAAARVIPPLRRRLDGLALKPPPRHRGGLVVRLGGEPPIVGAMLPQPRVLLADGRRALLDDVLGPWFALLCVDVPALELAALPWNGARQVRLVPPDRFPRGEAVTDLDGVIAPQLAGWTLVVRPDRFVLGAFRPADERRLLERWRALELDPVPIPDRSPA